MSYELKYRYTFRSIRSENCRVDIRIKGAEPGLTILDPGINPFVLREFNSDQDFFKPTRSFVAELQIVNSNVSMEDFLSEESDGVMVQFFFNDSLFWQGWLMQDDFEEPWIDTAHYITLRATDGLGTIASDPYPFLVGQQTMLDYLGYCIENTALGSLTLRKNYINNLFYQGMQDRSDGMFNPLAQATVDARTFEGDDKAKILEKINRAWSMTVFQYRGEWWWVRLEEFLNDFPLNGIEQDLFGGATFTKSFETNIGVGESIKPVMPEMFRSFRRPSKRTKISYFYRFPNEILCNQGFLSGDLIAPTTDSYTVDCWTLLKTSFGSPVAGTAQWYRKEIKDSDLNVIDNYLFIASDAALHYAKSQGVIMNAGDTAKINFDFKSQRNVSVGAANIQAAAVLFETSTNKYTLNNDGLWVLSNSSYTTFFQFINVPYSAAELLTDWKNVEVQSKGVPGPGTMYICFVNNHGTDTDSNFKGVEVAIREASKQPGVVGDYDQYELTGNTFQNYEEETFLDDSNNRQHKGALHFNGQLTGDNWYRMDYPSERLTFKRHKAIAHMILNKRNRKRLQVNMQGLTWLDGSNVRPIWVFNKFRFVDDAPTKKFMITNLAEMNFMESSWKANMIEVWDSELDTQDVGDYPVHSFANIYDKDV